MEFELSTPILDRVKWPADMRGLDMASLRQLADDVRAEMIHAVGQTGGHLGSGLGVVELTVAIHYVFNTPDDRLIWDVGHQAYFTKPNCFVKIYSWSHLHLCYYNMVRFFSIICFSVYFRFR